jgi:3-dehydroquinate synthase
MISTVSAAHSIEVTVSSESNTTVLLGRGLLASASDCLQRYRSRQLLLISDEHVMPLYGNTLLDELKSNGYEVAHSTIPAGEAAKSLDTLAYLYDVCLSKRIERGDVIVAAGGGAVGDTAGMLAATYLRGLELVQVPTTLVAIITASIGGKVGVNFKHHKNLIGAFKHPSLILADTETLSTLPQLEFRSGLGELITVGVLGAPEIFLALESKGLLDFEPLMAGAIRCKKSIVEADPYDQLGIRAKLNLGHTFGHALETLSNFTLPHGLAVAVGLHIATTLAASLKICAADLPDRIRRALVSLDLPTTLNGYRSDDVIEAMQSDKKRGQGQLRWVLPKSIGDVVLVEESQVPLTLLRDVLEALVWRGDVDGKQN